MSTTPPARPGQDTPFLLRNVVQMTTARIAALIVGSVAFVLASAWMLVAHDELAGHTFRLLFVRFVAGGTTIAVIGAVGVLFFGLGAVIGVWELIRRAR